MENKNLKQHHLVYCPIEKVEEGIAESRLALSSSPKSKQQS